MKKRLIDSKVVQGVERKRLMKVINKVKRGNKHSMILIEIINGGGDNLIG